MYQPTWFHIPENFIVHDNYGYNDEDDDDDDDDNNNNNNNSNEVYLLETNIKVCIAHV